ncbi:MAG: ABC transporter ATP-binding protein [Candidatus Paceibacterota bacterium]|jgi:NitT/TauT family transport system ATP-binding protein
MSTKNGLKAKPVVNGEVDVHIESAFHGYNDDTLGRKKIVLHNIDLVVDRGEFVCMVGPSGCGKSTLLKLVTGQERVQVAHHFDVLNHPVGFPDKHRGVVFQKYTLQPHLTVEGNVMLGLELQASIPQLISPRWRKEARKIVARYIERMRLSDAKDKYPRELSGGMQQRAAIAQTLVTVDLFKTPSILCMDEPFGALDPGTREDMQVLILELWEKYKMTVFFVTHDLEEAVFLASRIIVLSQFWTSDKPADKQEGSRIVMDIALERKAMSTLVKKTPEFGALVKRILDEGFNPRHRSHVDNFNQNLLHPRSFQSLSLEESHINGTFHEQVG